MVVEMVMNGTGHLIEHGFISSQLINIENEVEVNFEKLENNKSDIKIELLDTLMCNANFFKLTNNSSYPILQGGCLSDDGLNIKIV